MNLFKLSLAIVVFGVSLSPIFVSSFAQAEEFPPPPPIDSGIPFRCNGQLMLIKFCLANSNENTLESCMEYYKNKRKITQECETYIRQVEN